MKALLRKDPGGPSLSPFHSELDMSVRAFSISLATTEKRYWYLGSSTIPVSGTGLSFRWFVLPGNEDSWCQSTCCRPDTLLCTAASWCCCCCLRDDAAKAQIACPHSQLVSDRAGIWTQADLCPEPVLTIPWHCLSSNHDILYSDEGNWCQEDMAKKSVNYWRWGEALSLLAFSLFLLFIFKPLKLLSNSQEIGDMPLKYLAQCPAHAIVCSTFVVVLMMMKAELASGCTWMSMYHLRWPFTETAKIKLGSEINAHLLPMWKPESSAQDLKVHVVPDRNVWRVVVSFCLSGVWLVGLRVGEGWGWGKRALLLEPLCKCLGALCTSISSLLFVGTADPTELPLGS